MLELVPAVRGITIKRQVRSQVLYREISELLLFYITISTLKVKEYENQERLTCS